MRRRLSILVACMCGAVGVFPAAAAAKPVKVAATLSTFADLAKTVGGDRVEVSAVASPKFNPHFIEPKPSDVLKVKRADLFIDAGLDLELWRGPLLDAAGNARLFPGGPGELDLSQGLELLEVPGRGASRAQGDLHLYGNPHYWHDPENAKRMATAIAEKLSALDPEHAGDYRRNLQAFLARLDQKIPEWQSRLAPYRGRELVGDHRAWPYLMRFLGLQMEQHLEPKPGIPPTPRQIEFLEQYIRERRIPAIVRAGYFPPGAAESLAKRTGAKVVLLCQSVREIPACSDYIAMLDYNVNQLVEALRP
ncbi:MAG: zinc ABC transporter substrate-binding protein [Candidatus Omnitrophica bacterium]|nr:zinc ABC transporter substrate-binding protein [Candidatus Omnitrophota bacterium]